MKIKEKLQGALARLGGSVPARRRTLALPSILNTYAGRADQLPKATPVSLRRFAETPVARKAINTIKDRIAGMRWRVQPRAGRDPAPELVERVRVLTANLEAPNPDDSFRSLSEQVLEDIIVGSAQEARR